MPRTFPDLVARQMLSALVLVVCLAASPAQAQSFIRSFGSAGSGPGQFQTPRDVAVDVPNGSNILVADAVNNRIQIFTALGAFISTFGSAGTGPGQFNEPAGVAVDAANGSNIVVADAQNDRIQIFTASGAFLSQFGSLGSGPGQFHQPFGVAVDPANASNIVVADASNNRIQVFTSNGTFIRTFGSAGTGPGQFAFPTGVAIDTANNSNVVVAEQNGARVQVLSATGSFIRSFGTGILNRPTRVAVDLAHNSNVLVSDQGSDQRIVVFTATGQLLGTIGAPGTGPGQFNGGPTGLSLDTANADNIVVGDFGNERIQVFTNGFNPPIPVPTLGAWALALSGLLLAAVACRRLRRPAA